MATNTHFPYLQTSIMYEDGNNDFIGNTLNTPDIVDMLDSFHPTFQSEKTYNNDHQIFTDVYSQLDGQITTSTTTTNMNPMILNSSSPSSSSSSSLINNNNQTILMSNGNSSSLLSSSYGYIDSPLSNHQQPQQQNYYERKSYSPLLESSEINLENMSSPEMAPVSPNKVCPHTDYNYSQQQYSDSSSSNSNNSNSSTTIAYQNLETAQPIIIKDEFDEMSSLVDYLSDQSQSATTTTTTTTAAAATNTQIINPNTSTTQQYYTANSPACSISSNYSLDSCQSQPKTFATLDNVINIKQEPIDSQTILIQQSQQQQQYQSIVPTVVDETIVSATFLPDNCHHQQQNTTTTTDLSSNQIIYNLTPVTSNNTNNNGSTANYYYMSSTPLNTNSNNTNIIPNNSNSLTTTLSIPSTSSTINHNNVHQPQQQQQQSHGRKRGANNFVVGLHQSTTNGTKKQRMSKREKQKLMESCIERYESENKQLAEQIKLFEKQINFCKKYLNENVAPYLQKQQLQKQPIHQQLQSFIGIA